MIEPKDIIDILAMFVFDEERWYYSNPNSDYWHWGNHQRQNRLAGVAALAARSFPGAIAEIGCERGLTTELLGKVAQRYDRKVIAVDPWDTSVGSCNPGDYEEFMDRMDPFAHILDVVRLDSRSKEAIYYLDQPLCFAFVDGLHTYGACLSDIRAVHHAGIIAVDDVQNNWEMMRAFAEGAGSRRKIAHAWCKEKYIL